MNANENTNERNHVKNLVAHDVSLREVGEGNESIKNANGKSNELICANICIQNILQIYFLSKLFYT